MPTPNDYLRNLAQDYAHLKDEYHNVRNELMRLRQALRSLSALQRSLDLISPQSDPYQILNSILSTALEAVDSKDGSLLLLDEETNELVFAYVLGSTQKSLAGYRLPSGEGIASWCVANRKPQLVPDVSKDTHFSTLADQKTGFQTKSLICVPLTDNDRPIGAIEVVNTTSGIPFREEDLDIMLIVARLAAIAIIRAEDPHRDIQKQ
jgi:sigma-B regulation protein RsbU (phosphoserine phosphatase)